MLEQRLALGQGTAEWWPSPRPLRHDFCAKLSPVCRPARAELAGAVGDSTAAPAQRCSHQAPLLPWLPFLQSPIQRPSSPRAGDKGDRPSPGFSPWKQGRGALGERRCSQLL